MISTKYAMTEAVYMRRALDLAAMARGYTEPNPMVGAVIVADGRIIGEGYHHGAGQPHAEVMAIESVSQADRPLIAGSTMYVTLEPCSHYGKTPPCAEFLIRMRLGRVIIAMPDPFPQVSGRGIRILEQAGIAVQLGLLETEAESLNEVFLTVQRLGRPFVTLKWAQSADGFVDRVRSTVRESAVHFSSPIRQRYVHRMRSQHGAILVGGRTAMLDDPALDCRYWQMGAPPLRVVWSNSEVLDPRLKIFDGRPTLILCGRLSYAAVEKAAKGRTGIELLRISNEQDTVDLLLSNLLQREIHSLLVEGGSMVLQAFLDRGLYDRIDREISPIVLQHGVQAPSLPPTAESRLR